jgi:hypothetical protein
MTSVNKVILDLNRRDFGRSSNLAMIPQFLKMTSHRKSGNNLKSANAKSLARKQFLCIIFLSSI